MRSHQTSCPTGQDRTLYRKGDYISHPIPEHSWFPSREDLDAGYIFHPHGLPSNDPVYPLQGSCDSPSYIRNSLQKNHELNTHASPNTQSENKNEAIHELGWTIFEIRRDENYWDLNKQGLWTPTDELIWKKPIISKLQVWTTMTCHITYIVQM